MNAPAELIVAVFPDRPRAQVTLDVLKDMNRQGAVRLVDAALVTKDPSGKVHHEELRDLTARKGAERGAIAGGLIGLIFPPSLIVSAAIGGAAGALIGKLRDTGMKTGDLEQVGANLRPGESAVIALVEDRWLTELTQALQGYDRIFRQALNARSAAVLASDPETGQLRDVGSTTDDEGVTVGEFVTDTRAESVGNSPGAANAVGTDDPNDVANATIAPDSRASST